VRTRVLEHGEEGADRPLALGGDVLGSATEPHPERGLDHRLELAPDDLEEAEPLHLDPGPEAPGQLAQDELEAGLGVLVGVALLLEP